MSKQILSKAFNNLKGDLIKAYDEKGMRASGNWEDELEVYTDDNIAILFGEDYTQQLQYGRAAGKQPPTAVIEQWIYDKGIDRQIQNEISVSSLAFLIARKIGQEGWKREEYGGVELISEIVTPERIQSIIDEVGDEQVLAFTSDIIKLTKQLEAV